MVELKTRAELEKMREAGRFVDALLTELVAEAKVGTNLLALEHLARRRIDERGAVSAYWDYAPDFGDGPFRNVTCLSVNDAALHGLPQDYELRDGDLLSIDIVVSINGWNADAARSIIVGKAKRDDARLLEAVDTARKEGTSAARVGSRIGDISSAIGNVARDYGYAVNTTFGGHGIGRTMHEGPDLPNDGRPGRGMLLQHGMTLAIEPWFGNGHPEIAMDPDGWTIRMADGSRAAHSENTVAITDDGPVVLTAP